jgi:group I intron endonuclease
VKEQNKKWFGIIYVITNLVNGKQYVGKTQKSLEARWSGHIIDALGKSKYLIHKAIRSHKPENFSRKEIQHCRTLKTLNQAEIRWIKKLGTLIPNGYNMTTGGEGGVYAPTKADRKKMSAAQTLRFAKEEERAALSATQKRRFENMTEEERAGFRAIMVVAQKLRFANITEDERATISATAKQRFENMTEEDMQAFRDGLSAGMTRYWSVPSNHAAHVAITGSPAVRKKISTSLRIRWDTMTAAERKAYHRATNPLRKFKHPVA